MNNRQLEREANEIGSIVDLLMAEIDLLEQLNQALDGDKEKLQSRLEELEALNTTLEEQVLELKSILP